MHIRCSVTRGGYRESEHVVLAVVVDDEGRVVFSAGDPQYPTFARSTLKPFQAAASLKAGAVDSAGFSDEEVALMCGSHNGEDIHTSTAKSMMDKLGYPISLYECGIHEPYDSVVRRLLVEQGAKPNPLHVNCSGKHAGMLCLAKYLKVQPEGYTDPGHPVQQLILDGVRHYSGISDFPVAVDGCNAPTPFLPLYSIALLFQKLGSSRFPELDRVHDIMTKHPYLVAGRRRFDTEFITAMNGRAISKVGGEGIQGLCIRSKHNGPLGVAIKVLDGHQRALSVATMALLNHLKLLENAEETALDSCGRISLLNNRDLKIGEITADVYA